MIVACLEASDQLASSSQVRGTRGNFDRISTSRRVPGGSDGRREDGRAGRPTRKYRWPWHEYRRIVQPVFPNGAERCGALGETNVQRRTRWIILGLFLSTFFVFDVAVAAFGEVRGDEMTSFVLGVVSAQITLLAVWTAWSPASVFVRVTSGLTLAALVSLCFYFAIDHGPSEESAAISGALMLQWIAVQAPLWLIRIVFGWHVGCWDEIDRSEANETQFGIRQLLVWTMLVAVALGITRIVLPDDVISELETDPRMYVAIISLLAVFNSLLALPIIWACFVKRQMLVWLVAAIGCCIVMSVAEIFAFRTAISESVDTEIFWYLNAVQFIGAYFTLIVVRLCGFRLVRRHCGAGGGLTSP